MSSVSIPPSAFTQPVTATSWPLPTGAATEATLLLVSKTTDAQYIDEKDFDGSGNLIYFGLANPGSATSAASWQIRKITWTGANPTSTRYAGGSRGFTNIWDNRAGLSYS